MTFFNFYVAYMVQKYQNESAPIFYYGKSPKTSRKHLNIPYLQALTLGLIIKITLYLHSHILQNNFSSLVYWVAPPVARVTTNSSCCSAPLLPLSRAILLSQAARTGSQQSGACIPSISIKLVQQTNQTFFTGFQFLDRMFNVPPYQQELRSVDDEMQCFVNIVVSRYCYGNFFI